MQYVSIQWALTSAGSTVGALIAFGVNVKKHEATGVSTAVYIVFIVIMCCAIAMSCFIIVDPKKVVRADGRHIAVFKEPNFVEEFKGMVKVLIDPKIVILMPAMFVGEMNMALVSSINSTLQDRRSSVCASR